MNCKIDFDFGVHALSALAKATKFPWIISNVFDESNGKPIADGKEYVVIENNGLKIGFIGLVEK